MQKNLKAALCQTSFEVGNIAGNAEKILQIYNAANCDLVVFPELSLTGYNCKDLFLNDNFLNEAELIIQKIAAHTNHKGLIIGAPMKNDFKQTMNSALLMYDGKIQHRYDKKYLANYGVFDEKRYFAAGHNSSSVFVFKNHSIGIMICEDAWQESTNSFAEKSDLLIIINASPFSINKQIKRVEIVEKFVEKAEHIAYLNCFCAQDHLIFDGGSFVMYNKKMIVPPVSFKNEIITFDLWQENFESSFQLRKSDVLNLSDDMSQSIYSAILLSLTDYAKYSNINKFVIGLSGGIDSALVAVIAADAFGPENILCVAMPSQYSSENSLNDAINLAKKIGCKLEIIPISSIKNELDKMLHSVTGNLQDNEITNENLQPRIRATILMAIANKQNRLLLCTSNKSETAVGYTTLYGDMSGGFAPIIDVYKTQVYALCKWRNKNIPQNGVQVLNTISQDIINKEPSAELKPNQKDSDSLPEYSMLDRILYEIIEKNIDRNDEFFKNIKQMLYKNEFKRYQSPPGPKINSVMLNNDRRYPISTRIDIK